MRIVILGAPGSGKGTQAKLLANKLKLPHLSTGDLLREEIRKKSRLGKRAKPYVECGSLVPDKLVTEMLEHRLRAINYTKGFILDGYPRNREQALLLAKFTPIDVVINLMVEEKTLTQRLTLRRTCRHCGVVYHLKYNPPRRRNRCDACGGELYQREDDTAQVVRKRLEDYKHRARGLMQYCQAMGKLKNVDANAGIKNVFKRVCAKIEK